MCEPASFVIIKDRIYWDESIGESHSDIIEHFKLQDQNVRSEITLVRVECIPPNEDFTLPFEQWVFRVDQDCLPDWWDADAAEKLVRKTLPDWRAAKVCLPGQERIAKNEYVIAYGNSTVRAYGNSTVRAYGNSTVKASGNSTVRAYGNSTVRAYDNSTVQASDNSTVQAYGNSTVKASGNSTVRAYGNSTVRAYDNSTVQASGNSTVQAYGNSTVRAYDNSTVQASDNSTVQAYGNSTVCKYNPASTCTLSSSPMAVIIDRTGNKAVCTVGGQL